MKRPFAPLGTALALALAACLAPGPSARAEVLPVRSYTALDGLPHDRVKRIREDAIGFLWFCTTEGLGRFDGRDFVTYGMREGLPAPSTNDLLFTPGGAWVATNGGGIAYFEPSATTPRFQPVKLGPDGASRVNVLLLDAEGTLFAGTDAGIFRMPNALSWREDAAFERVPVGIPGTPEESVMVWAFLETEAGVLAGTRFGLLLVTRAGRVTNIPVPGRGDGIDTITALARDARGRILAGHLERGLYTLDPKTYAVLSHLGVEEGLPSVAVMTIGIGERQTFLGTEDGLAVLTYEGESPVPRVLTYGTHEGLTSARISAVHEDRHGGLWLGTPGSGLMSVSLSGDALYRASDGLGDLVGSVFERRSGELCVVSSGWTLSRPEGRGFRSVRPGLPRSIDPKTWRVYQSVLEDHEGAFWFATREGLYRFPKVTHLEELEKAVPRRYTVADGLATNDVSQLFEDRDGNIWIGAFIPAESPLTRFHRETGRFERFGANVGLPAIGSPSAFIGDAHGGVWIAYRDGTLARYRDGHFDLLAGRRGFPSAQITGFTTDPSGRLWAATFGHGLVRVDDPGAREPSAVVLGSAQGVTAFHMNRLVSDNAGRIYFGTSRAVMLLDPATGTVSEVRAARGIVSSEATGSLRDREGRIWLAGWRGLARLEGRPAQAAVPPGLRLSAVSISGSPRPVPGTGAETLDLGELQHSANLSFEFFGLGLAGEPLLYQHRLDGLDLSWSTGRKERTVQYDHLAGGSYQFLVKAVAAGGETSPVARVSFRIRPPFYRRWWFLAGTAFLLVGAGYAVEAVRWRQRRALDDVRARLAKDLHDDLGASLSRLSILSEVAARRERDGASSRDIIETIGEVSRSVVERLADGIWAVDPRRDDLGSLGERLRLQAAEVLDPLGVSWRIEIPQGAAEVPLHPERRRHVYLLFKEALTNAARHSAARHLVLGVSAADGFLSFTLHDDGRGFDTGLTSGERRLVGGNGLANMKTRAEALGGELLVTSAPGKGTRITLKIPLTGA